MGLARRTEALEEIEEMLLVQARRLVQAFETPEGDLPPTLDVFKALTSVHRILSDALKLYPEDNAPKSINEALLALKEAEQKLLKKQREQAEAAH